MDITPRNLTQPSDDGHKNNYLQPVRPWPTKDTNGSHLYIREEVGWVGSLVTGECPETISIALQVHNELNSR